jgi:hypothetical protein
MRQGLGAVGVLPCISRVAARRDLSVPGETCMAEYHAYQSLMVGLDRLGHDIVHNNSLHHLPVAMAGTLNIPRVTTLQSHPRRVQKVRSEPPRVTAPT